MISLPEPFQARVWLKATNKLGLAALKQSSLESYLASPCSADSLSLWRNAADSANPSSAGTIPGRKEYRSERLQLVRGCFLGSGCFAEDFVAFAVFTHPPIQHTLLPLNSFQNTAASTSTCPSNLTFPEVKGKESRFPTAGNLGAGKTVQGQDNSSEGKLPEEEELGQV